MKDGRIVYITSQGGRKFQKSKVNTVKYKIIGDNNWFLASRFDWKEVSGNLPEKNFSNTSRIYHQGEHENKNQGYGF